MEDSLLAFYWMLVERKMQDRPNIHWTDSSASEYLDYRRTLSGEFSGTYEMAEKTYSREAYLSEERISQWKSKINKILLNKLGKKRAESYLIKSMEKILDSSKSERVGLEINKNNVEVIPE